jgi:hypothetical protein
MAMPKPTPPHDLNSPFGQQVGVYNSPFGQQVAVYNQQPMTQYTQPFQQFPPKTMTPIRLGHSIKTVTQWAGEGIDSIDWDGGCGDCIVDKNGSLFIRQERNGESILYEISNLSREEKLMIASAWLKQINQTPKEIPSDEE